VVIAFYISGHGFGHAARSVELIDVLTARQPDLRIVVRTSAHPWPLERIRQRGIEIQPCETDSGVAQVDGLVIDEGLTATRAAQFYATFERRIADEAAYLRTLGAGLVVADIPPLAFAAAEEAGVPSVAVANFTWDWIYAYFPDFETTAPGVIGTIGSAYARATRALRLPIHGGFERMMAVVQDIPFIARRSTRDPSDTRRALEIDGAKPLVLSSFGGYGVTLSYDRAAAAGLTVLVPPPRLPDGLKHEDLVSAADVVVSKPGYGIVSECVAHGRPLLYASRGRFAEYEVMVAEMPRMLRCRHIGREELVAGDWADSITALLAQPEPPERVAVDGAAVAAETILDLVVSR
jgi:UDP:flavonoid glycosyltransferase YjiC (YdhE family)